jgi:hypothetical protein
MLASITEGRRIPDVLEWVQIVLQHAVWITLGKYRRSDNICGQMFIRSSIKTKEILKYSLSGMKCKAHGTERPRHINEIGEEASTAQRRNSTAHAFNQRFLNDIQSPHHY